MWRIITESGKEEIISDIKHKNAIDNGVEYAFDEQVSDDTKESAEEMNRNIALSKVGAMSKGSGPVTDWLSNLAMGTSKFIAPDAYQETIEGKPIGVGTAKSLGKGALTAGSMLLPVAAVPNIAGRIGLSGGLGLADYIGSKAIDTEMPTLPGAALATGLGALGQGIGEGVGKIGTKLVGKSFNVDEDVAKKLLNEDVIGIR
jgi:hypothetical protein